MSKKTIVHSISFQFDVWNFLKERKNLSEFVNKAVRDLQSKLTTPELRRNLLLQQKRELIKELNKLSEEIDDLETIYELKEKEKIEKEIENLNPTAKEEENEKQKT